MSFRENTDPKLDDLIDLVAEQGRLAELGPIPARVTAYNAATQTCDAQPLVMVPKPTGLSLPPIARDVQVCWPSGSTWSLVGPMVAGDLVWLVPAGADIGPWKASGSEASPSACQRRLDPSDVVAIPGSRPLSAPLGGTAYDATAAVLAGTVKLGSSAAALVVALDTDDVIKGTIAAGDLMATWMGQVETAINILASGSVTPLSTTFTKIGTVMSSATKVLAI